MQLNRLLTITTFCVAFLLLSTILGLHFSNKGFAEECKQELSLCRDPPLKLPLSPELVESNSKILQASLKLGAEVSLVKVAFPFDLNTTFFVYKSDKMIKWVNTAKSEIQVARVFADTLSTDSTKEDIVLDIGSNTGWFGLYSAARGYKTFLFDPQPTCGQWIRSAILMNGFDNVATLVPHPVGVNEGTMGVSPSTGCAGRFPQLEFEKGNTDLSFTDEIQVPFVSIDKVFPNATSIKLVKIDTEGAEYFVLESMLNLLKNKVVQNLIVETTPKFWPRMGISRKQVAEMYEQIWNFGYKCRALYPPKIFDSSEELHEWAEKKNFVQIDILFELK